MELLFCFGIIAGSFGVTVLGGIYNTDRSMLINIHSNLEAITIIL